MLLILGTLPLFQIFLVLLQVNWRYKRIPLEFVLLLLLLGMVLLVFERRLAHHAFLILFEDAVLDLVLQKSDLLDIFLKFLVQAAEDLVDHVITARFCVLFDVSKLLLEVVYFLEVLFLLNVSLIYVVELFLHILTHVLDKILLRLDLILILINFDAEFGQFLGELVRLLYELLIQLIYLDILYFNLVLLCVNFLDQFGL